MWLYLSKMQNSCTSTHSLWTLTGDNMINYTGCKCLIQKILIIRNTWSVCFLYHLWKYLSINKKEILGLFLLLASYRLLYITLGCYWHKNMVPHIRYWIWRAKYKFLFCILITVWFVIISLLKIEYESVSNLKIYLQDQWMCQIHMRGYHWYTYRYWNYP